MTPTTDRDFAITTYRAKQDNKPKAARWTWDVLAKKLMHHDVRADKNKNLWSPASYPEGYNGGRENAGVESICCFVLDFDKGQDPELLKKRWTRYEYVVHSTHNSCEAFPKWRIVFPFSSPVPAAQWRSVRAKLVVALGRDSDPDGQCKDESRMYYMPSCPPERADQTFTERHEGQFLDPDEIPDLDQTQTGIEQALNGRPQSRQAYDPNARKVDFKSLAEGNVPDQEKHGAMRDGIFRARREDWSKEACLSLVESALHSFGSRLALPMDQEIAKWHTDVEHVWQTVDPDPEFENGKRKPRAVTSTIARSPACAITDLTNAELLQSMFGEDIRHCAAWNRFLIWDGNRWVVDETKGAPLIQRASQVLRWLEREAAEIEDNKDRANRFKVIFAHQSRNKLEGMVGIVKALEGVAVTPDSFDPDQWLLCVQNGTLDLNTGRLRSSRREDLITKQAGTIFDPTAACPRWEQFISEVLCGNEDLIRFMKKSVGLALTGDTSEQVLWLLYGNGSNGKSVFVETILFLLGDYALRTKSDLLMIKQNEGSGEAMARLRGARLVAASEIEDGRKLNEARVKDLTGGEKIVAEKKYGEEFEFEPRFKLWLAGNHRPVIRGTDEGIWRRVLQIPFTVFFPLELRDPYLADKLKAEAPGILNWALAGLELWQLEGLDRPAEITEAVEEYRNAMDVLGAFLDEATEKCQGEKVKPRELYTAFKKWTTATGAYLFPEKEFAIKLRERGETRKTVNGTDYWADRRLREEYVTTYDGVWRGGD